MIILKFKILVSIIYNKNVQECNLYYKHIIIIVKKSNRIISTQILRKSFLEKQFNLTNFIENVSNNSFNEKIKKFKINYNEMIIDVSEELCTLNSYVDKKIPEDINLKFPKKSYSFKAIEETKEKVILNDIMNYNYNEELIYNNIQKMKYYI